MSTVGTLARRELGAYFLSPIAYAVMAMFLFSSGMAFGLGTFYAGGEASLRQLFEPWMVFILVFVLPMLTMRLISDELRMGTIETLMTAPVTETQIVLGKFLGAWTFFVLLLAALIPYPLLLGAFGPVDSKLLFCHLLGVVLMGGLFIAVGLFFSACTKHQVVSVLLSLTLLVLMTFASDALAQKFEGWFRVFLQQLSVRSHFRDFVRGMFDLNHAVFFITTTAFFLFITVKRLEVRRWQ